MAAAISSFAVYTSTADATSYTSNNLAALGSTGRPVVCVVCRSASNFTFPTVSIGGVALEPVSSNGSGMGMVAFYMGDEGMSGEVTVVASVTLVRVAIIMWRDTGTDTTYGRAGQGQTTSNNTAFNVALASSPLAGNNAGGAIHGAAHRTISGGGGYTWTGLTEDYDAIIEAVMLTGFASAVFGTGGNKSVNANSSAGANFLTRAFGLNDGPAVIASQRFDPTYTPSHLTLRGDNARVLHTNGIYHDDYILGVTEAGSGKYYVEFYLLNSYNMANTRVGIADKAQLTLDNGSASGNSFYGYSFAGDIWADGADTGTDTGWGTPVNGDRVCIEIDNTAKTIRARLNNGTWSATQNYSGGSLATVRWAVSLNNDDEELSITDSVHWAYTPTSGYGEISASGGATNYPLTADPASYAETGSDANQKISGAAAAGAYALTGADANQKISGSAGAGSYALTGSAALQKISGSAAAGSYSLTVADATLTYTPVGTVAYSLTADAAAYSLTVNDATLTYVGAINYSLAANAGSYSVAVSDATLSWSGEQTQHPTSAGRAHGATQWNKNWNRKNEEEAERAAGETPKQKAARIASERALVEQLLVKHDARRDQEAMLLLLM